MDDEQLPVEDGAVDSPDPVDYEKRYKDTHANWNQLNEQMTRFKSDPNAILEFIQETHPELLADPDEEEDPQYEYEEPDEEDRPLTKAEFDAYKREIAQAQIAQTSQQKYETDLQTFVNGRELDEFGERAIRATPGVTTPEQLKKVVDDWFAREEARTTTAKPRVPHAVTTGPAATQVPDWNSMSQGDINKYMAERVRSQETQT